MIGLDTGYFVQLLRGLPNPADIWRELMEGEEEAVVSCLTLFEIERLRLKGAIWDAEVLLEAIPAVCRVIWINTSSMLVAGAALSHGLGIPAMDALILDGLISTGAVSIYTTDSHFEKYHKEGVRIINLTST